MNQIYAAIDYSMTCPCLCLHQGNTFSYSNCQFHYLTDCQKRVLDHPQFHGKVGPKPNGNNAERFEILANFILQSIPSGAIVSLEGYSYGSKGTVFEIGENTGLFKYLLWKNLKIVPHIIPPTTIKKYAFGKGNAKKEQMIQSFVKKTECDIEELFGTKGTKILNPISDIVDAYFLCDYIYHKFPV